MTAIFSSANDHDIEKTLNNLPKEIVNYQSDDFYEETLLMRAVWMLRVPIVKLLLTLRANVKYTTSTGESVSTYWDHDKFSESPKHMESACQIAELLHQAGVDLSQNSDESWSLVKRAKVYQLQPLIQTLNRLGYKI